MADNLIESELIESGWGELVDPRERLNDEAEFYGTGVWSRPFTTIDDRADGKLIPIYQTEIDLARIRAAGRNLATIDGVAIGAIESLANYIFGKTGIQFVVQPESDEAPQGLAELVQSRLDLFLDTNEFHGELDREIHQRSREDGEAFVELSHGPRGIVSELFEPDQVKQPAESHKLNAWILDRFNIDCDAFVPSWSFGLLTPQHRCNRVLGYHVVRDAGGIDWDFLPAHQVQHFKRNVPKSAKRGVSDLYAVLEDMRNESKLSRNMVLGAALQAAIAWIEDFPIGTTEAQAKSIGNLGAESTIQRARKDGGQATVNKTRLQPGTIVRTSPGRTFKTGPMGAERNAGFITVGQYIMRRIGVRWTIPESLISGDASNANMASALVAEAPFVHAREADQQWYGRRFLSMLWKVVRLDFEAGYFNKFGLSWELLEQFVKIVPEYPAVATRDKLQQAQVHETYVRMGVLSRATAATEAGYDLEEEVEKGATSQEDAAAAAQQTKDEREYDLARQSLELQAIAAPVTGVPNSVPETTTSTPVTPLLQDVGPILLNGAQIESLLAIVGQLTSGIIPAESARAIIKAAFPTMSDSQIDGILSPLVNFSPPPGVVESMKQVTRHSMLTEAIEAVRTTDEARTILESLRCSA